jgi:hypothetical protein
MSKSFLKIYLFFLSLVYLPITAQNMASIEAPSGIAFVYGLDYHPKWYTQLKPTVGFAWANSSLVGKTNEVLYAFIVEQRYYYNIVKREFKGKNTLNKSANFFSVKPAYVFARTKYGKNNPLVQLTGKNTFDRQIFWCSVNWGLRRAMGKRFYFDGSIGFGPYYSNYDKEWEAIIDLNISIGFKLF